MVFLIMNRIEAKRKIVDVIDFSYLQSENYFILRFSDLQPDALGKSTQTEHIHVVHRRIAIRNHD